MPIRSICPKCGKEGTQNVHATGRDRKKNKRLYLYMRHDDGKECYVGRVHSTEESLNEIEKPQTAEENLKEMTTQLKNLIDHYSEMSSGSVRTIVNRLKDIAEKYGY